MRDVRPPALAEWLLARSLPPADRAAVQGDLHESLRTRAAAEGPRAARRWYRRQVARSIVPNVRRRLERHSPRTEPTGDAMTHAIAADLRLALRMLSRRPLLTTAAVLSLALGIGLSAGVFSLYEAAVLRPLPLHEPHELRVVLEVRERNDNHNFTYPGFVDFREVQQSFTDVVALSRVEPVLRAETGSEPIAGEIVSGSYFDTLRPAMHLGRGLTDADNAAGAPPVVVLSALEWRDRFGGRDHLGDASITLNGVAFAVVGVTEAPFRGMVVGGDARFWATLVHQPVLEPTGSGANLLAMRTTSWLTVLGRLKPGVSDAMATAELNVVGAPLTQMPEPKFRLAPGAQGDSGLPATVSSPLSLLLGAAGLVLLVACANVAGLLLARAQERSREIAVRTALGAGRWRIARLLLTESLALGAVGTALGVVAARAFAPMTVAFFTDFGEPVTLDITLNAPVLAFTAAAGLASTVLAGLMPAWRTAAGTGAGRLDHERADTGSRSAVAWRRGLVVAQFALTLALVTASLLLVRTLVNLTAIPTGLDVDRVALLSVDPTSAQYRGARVSQYFDEAIARLEALPGVARAAYGRVIPVGFGGSRYTVTVPGYTPAEGEDMEINTNVVSSGYFDALGIEVLDGRTFSSADAAGRPLVIVANETMARRYWPGGRAVGRVVHLGDETDPTAEVIGVVRDVKYRMLREEARPSFYVPMPQSAFPRGGVVHVRTAGDPAALLERLRRTLAETDRAVPVSSAITLRDQVAANVTRERATMVIGVTLGASAVILSAVGLFAAMATMVGRRSREIGVRMALGATPAAIGRQVLREGVRMAAWGSLAGLALAFWLGRLIEARLYGVSPFDPVSVATAAASLAAIALAASWRPARRAATVDPLRALRVD